MYSRSPIEVIKLAKLSLCSVKLRAVAVLGIEV
jgi:hypothetical protein